MNLCEEYCRRHTLKCPIIHRPKDIFQVLYRSDPKEWGTPWTILNISRRTEDNHPSFYVFGYMIPCHSRIFHGRFWDYAGNSTKVEWDEYDVNAIRFAMPRNGLILVDKPSEIRIALWEAFLYGADDRVPTLSLGIRKKMLKSLDPTLSSEQRLALIEESIRDVREVSGSFYSKFDSLFTATFQSILSSRCFVDIVQQMQNQAYRQEFSELEQIA